MSRKGSGYNNPAFCNQFDTSLYDYEYVPEIDPDSPDLERKGSYRPPRQVPPWNLPMNEVHQKNNQTELNNSDESNGSVIVEECNNRRVTMICEKRPTVIKDANGGYVHDISLESSCSNEAIQSDFRTDDYANRNIQPKSSGHYRENSIRGYQHNKRSTTSVRPAHRYEELSSDEFVEEHREDYNRRKSHRYAEIDEFELEGIHFVTRKPRAPSPIEYPSSRRNERNISPYTREFEESFSNCIPSSSPIQRYSEIEMSDFSPPQRPEMQRQPPVGASANHVSELPCRSKSMSKFIPMRVQNLADAKMRSPMKSCHDRRTIISSPKSKPEIVKAGMSGKSKSARRNIASLFSENSSPYRSTTQPSRSTAIITPILQRKFDDRGNFEESSRRFQSTSNVCKGFSQENQHRENVISSPFSKSEKLRRNKSVPNFQGANERSPIKLKNEVRSEVSPKTMNQFYELTMPQSPHKYPHNFSPMSRSRVSLLDNLKRSWSDLDNDVYVSPSICLLVTAAIQLMAGLVNCGLCFYLMSKLGRWYYLDFGMASGFINIVLGGLGFRSQYWKWLPNRNYVSGYLVLTAFSMMSCGFLTLIITVRPMAGAPILDLTAGGICGLSVLIITLALIGLTMSGCCKIPPPDNRVSST